jgi:type 1 glutamine amidotransferase
MRMLVCTKTAGYRHQSIPAGISALDELGALAELDIDTTEDTSVLNAWTLRTYALVIFLNTSGDILAGDEQAALADFVSSGGGFMGVHAAATTEYSWPYFGDLIGARFLQHPVVQPALVRVADAHHPATRHLAPEWPRVDEWYCFRENPRPHARVLLTVDESSYDGATMGEDHPIAWCHQRLGGRVFYTAMGHTVESYAEPAFRDHLLGGIRYAIGAEDGSHRTIVSTVE